MNKICSSIDVPYIDYTIKMNLIQALQTVLVLFKGIGVLPIKWQNSNNNEHNLIIKQSKLFYYYSIIIILFFLLLVMYSIPYWYYKFSFHDLENHFGTRAYDFSNFALVFLSLITGTTTLKFIICNQNDVARILLNLNNIASKIISTEYFSILKFKINIYFFVYVAIIIFESFYEPFMWPSEDSTLKNIIGFITIRVINISVEQQFLILSFIVENFMNSLNNTLEKINLIAEDQVRYDIIIKILVIRFRFLFTDLFIFEGLCTTRITALRDIYVSLWEVTRIMNAVYELPLLMWLIGHFMDILIGVFLLLVALLDKERSEVDPTQLAFGVIYWTPLVIIRNFVLCWTGCKVQAEVIRARF